MATCMEYFSVRCVSGGRIPWHSPTLEGWSYRVGFPEDLVETGILVSSRAKTCRRSMLARVGG